MLLPEHLMLMVGATPQGMLELRGFRRLSDARRNTSMAPGRFVERLVRLGSLYAPILASASVAQVHFATLTTGEEIVVKVQRRGAQNQMQRDLSVLARLGRYVCGHSSRACSCVQYPCCLRYNFADWHDVDTEANLLDRAVEPGTCF